MDNYLKKICDNFIYSTKVFASFMFIVAVIGLLIQPWFAFEKLDLPLRKYKYLEKQMPKTEFEIFTKEIESLPKGAKEEFINKIYDVKIKKLIQKYN